MTLRKLEKQDAPLMLEWMHDEELVHDLHKDFESMTTADCERFIESSKTDTSNIHMAIVDDNDEYLGTVSLKNINGELKTAEFGIVLRRKAIGKGISIDAMRQILQLGFAECGLEAIYWCVDEKNARACRFYDKNGYKRIQIDEHQELRQHIIRFGDYETEKINKYFWYLEQKQQ